MAGDPETKHNQQHKNCAQAQQQHSFAHSSGLSDDKERIDTPDQILQISCQTTLAKLREFFKDLQGRNTLRTLDDGVFGPSLVHFSQ
jgi:hypothetical protein